MMNIAYLILLITGVMMNSHDFEIRFEYIAGSMPPPHHFEYEIVIRSDGNCSLIYTPDYSGEGVPVWREDYRIEKTVVDQLDAYLVKSGLVTKKISPVKDDRIGGGYTITRILYQGKDIRIPDQIKNQKALEELHKRVKETVPQAIWDKIRGMKDAYDHEYEQKNKN